MTNARKPFRHAVVPLNTNDRKGGAVVLHTSSLGSLRVAEIVARHLPALREFREYIGTPTVPEADLPALVAGLEAIRAGEPADDQEFAQLMALIGVAWHRQTTWQTPEHAAAFSTLLRADIGHYPRHILGMTFDQLRRTMDTLPSTPQWIAACEKVGRVWYDDLLNARGQIEIYQKQRARREERQRQAEADVAKLATLGITTTPEHAAVVRLGMQLLYDERLLELALRGDFPATFTQRNWELMRVVCEARCAFPHQLSQEGVSSIVKQAAADPGGAERLLLKLPFNDGGCEDRLLVPLTRDAAHRLIDDELTHRYREYARREREAAERQRQQKEAMQELFRIEAEHREKKERLLVARLRAAGVQASAETLNLASAGFRFVSDELFSRCGSKERSRRASRAWSGCTSWGC